jgi:hypothetical protein
MVLNYGYQLMWGKPMPQRNNYHLGDGLIIQPTQNGDFGEVYGRLATWPNFQTNPGGQSKLAGKGMG